VKEIQWSEGAWVNPPVDAFQTGSQLKVTTAHESDFWRNTSYGFVHDSGHALLKEFPADSSMEVTFVLDYSGQFDQAGILVSSTGMDGQRSHGTSKQN
jgi:regulation of enolase protein 1 (concanavalin A-like superfamily)